MKKKIVMRSVILLYLTMKTISVSGQTTWQYTYDNTGNRTQRVVTTGTPARKKNSTAKLIDDEKVTAIMINNRNGIKVEVLGYNSSDMAEAFVYNLSGMQLISKRIESEITTLNLGKLRRGTYILALELNGETKNCKFNK